MTAVNRTRSNALTLIALAGVVASLTSCGRAFEGPSTRHASPDHERRRAETRPADAETPSAGLKDLARDTPDDAGATAPISPSDELTRTWEVGPTSEELEAIDLEAQMLAQAEALQRALGSRESPAESRRAEDRSRFALPPSAALAPEAVNPDWIAQVSDEELARLASPEAAVATIASAPPPEAPTPPVETPAEPVEAPPVPQPEPMGLDELIERARTELALSSEPLADMVRLAALESARPAAGAFTEPDTDALAPSEIKLVESIRSILRVFTSEEAAPETAIDALAEAEHELRALGQLRVADAAICRKVVGFGLYETFPTERYVAGATRRVIVYAEADGFAHREATDRERSSVGLDLNPAATGGDVWAVALGVELNLYHEADGVLAWRRPEQSVIDVSRRQRRDFYVVAEVDLPATLTVGGYQLKVTLRDKTTGAEDSKLLPIEVVADRSAIALGQR